MGDQIGQAVEGTLYYIPYIEFKRIREVGIPRKERATIYADMCRLNALYMIARAGSGHIGGSFSSLDISSWLLLEEVTNNDVYFSSKGHDAPGYYSAMIGMGRIEFDLIHKLRKIDGLPGHPDIDTPGIVTNTGSLGMGVSKAKGMVLANRLAKKQSRVFVMTGDGELQEGQFWESLISAANFKLHEITVIIDHNKLQSDTFIKHVSDLGDLEAKLIAFGWRVERCNGNDINELSAVLASMQDDTRPKIIIADTVKGKGVSFMEHTSLDSDVDMYKFHSGAPDSDAYQSATQEIMDRIKLNLREVDVPLIEVELVENRDAIVTPVSAQKLIPAYSKALIEQAEKYSNIVALDADLILDTGLIPFRDKYPDRFIECGIAEQDMVSIAGGMALNGILPIVHSFACFLSARPNEQIYNNATEKTKIIYVGSLAGVTPGGPGHSHQAVRDISTLAAIPGMTLVEPCCEEEVGLLLNWCINDTDGSSYIRLISIPCVTNYQLPKDYKLKLGYGVTLVDGTDVVIISAGPVLLNIATSIAKSEQDTSVKVINLPWLNIVDTEWLKRAINGCNKLIILDNHYTISGQGDAVLRSLVKTKSNIEVYCVGVNKVPPSGTNQQVMNDVGLSSEIIKEIINR